MLRFGTQKGETESVQSREQQSLKREVGTMMFKQMRWIFSAAVFACIVSGEIDAQGASPAWTAPVRLNGPLAPVSSAVAASPSGTFVAVWTQPSSINQQSDTYVRRSGDAGVTWGSIGTLHTNLNTGGSNYECHVATDGEGRWVAAFDSTRNPGSTINTYGYHLWVTRSSDDGRTWTPAAPILPVERTAKIYHRMPRLSSDGMGKWILGYRFSQDTWPEAPPNGYDSDHFSMVSADYGATWSAPTAINADAMTDRRHDAGLSLIRRGNGEWTAMWEDQSFGDVYEARSAGNGTTWSAPRQLHGVGSVAAGNGTGTWVTAGKLAYQFQASRSIDQGTTWSPGVSLVPPTVPSYAAAVAAGMPGTWIVVWSGANPAENDPASDFTDIMFSLSTDDAISWSAVGGLNSDWATDTRADTMPAIACDGEGNAVVLWKGASSPEGLYFSRAQLPRRTCARGWEEYE